MDDAYDAPAEESSVDFDIRGRATTANTLGIIALLMSMLGFCSGFMTFLFALPMALITIHYARTVLAEGPDEVSEVYARNAMTLGVISAAYSGIWLLFLAAYIMLYVGLIALVVVGNL